MNTEQYIKDEALRCADFLRKGNTLLYPTDTVWGLGCDATNSAAIDKIFEIKHRPTNKSLIVLVDSTDMLMRYVGSIPQAAFDIITMAEKPTSIIYESYHGLANNISPDGTVCIRVCHDEFCRIMIKELGRPIVSTSANISGEPTPHSFDEISETIKNSTDTIANYRRDEKTQATSSAIIKIEGNKIDIIRP